MIAIVPCCLSVQGSFTPISRFNSPLHDTYLCVRIFDTDIDGNHDKNSNGDTKVSDQTTELEKETIHGGQNHTPTECK